MSADMDELPEGWAWAQIPDACELNPPKPKSEAYPADTPVTFVPMPAVDADLGAITAGEIRTFAKVRAGFTAFRDLDVIMAKITPCMENGKAAVARRLDARFLMRWTQTPWCYQWMTQASGASAQPHLYIGDTKRMPVPVPPLAEQQEIVRRVDALFKLADAIERRVSAAAQRADKLTQAVLAKAFRGELVPTEADLAHSEGRDYEPASALLDHIRAKRAASAPSRKRRPRRNHE
jgi:type I restriction enzyme S subunit